MTHKIVRKVLNEDDPKKLNILVTEAGDLVYDKDKNLWFNDSQEYKQVANDGEVVHHFGDEEIKGKKTFDDETSFKSSVDVKGTSTFEDKASFAKGVDVSGSSDFKDSVTFDKDVAVTGKATLGTVESKGAASFDDNVTFAKGVDIKGNLTVEGTFTNKNTDDIDPSDLTFEAGISGVGKYAFKSGFVSILLNGVILPEVKANTALIIAKIPDTIKPTDNVVEVVSLSNGGVATVGIAKEGNIIITDGADIPANTTFSMYKLFDKAV